MYELHKTWCADTLLSNSVMCAIGVLQHDKQKCWNPKCINSALLEPRPLSICAELIEAVYCLTARKSPRNSSLPLGLAIYILRKMPRKPDESSVECYGHGFLIAARPRGV